MNSMKDQIKTPEERTAFSALMGRMSPAMLQAKTPEQMDQVLEMMDRHTASIDAKIRNTIGKLPKEIRDEVDLSLFDVNFDSFNPAAPPASTPQIPDTYWTSNQKRKITKLNDVIRRVSHTMKHKPGVSSKNVNFVYKAYHSARIGLAHGWDHVPIGVWDFLWKVFSVDESININRLSHISLLAKDMADAKVGLSPAQQVLAIEAIFVEGWEKKAVESWKRNVDTLGDDKAETFKDFWELGVRMCCKMGDIEQAEKAAKKVLDKRLDARILLPMIRSLSEKRTQKAQAKAWTLYRQMRECLGEGMTLEDYDYVVAYFLTTGQTENALYAFVDMMSEGEIDIKKRDKLPSIIGNKFFLGKWLKRLIGAGQLDGAYSVVTYMRTKGVNASPIHLNGLIGAWQRSGGADNMAKADTLAWNMIEARVNFVEAREAGREVAASQPDELPWPPATRETIILMAANYRVRELHQNLLYLWKASLEAKINLSASIMNHLLESYCKAGEVDEAMALYDDMVRRRGVMPDGYTFSAMWKTLGVNRYHTLSPGSVGRETRAARALFAELMSFKQVFTEEAMAGQLARRVLHTFRRLGDDAGVVVALAAMRRHLGYMVPDVVVLEMVLDVGQLSWDTPEQRRRLIHGKTELDRQLRVLSGVGGDRDTKVEGAPRAAALYEYLRNHYSSRCGPDGAERLAEAMREMGVDEVNL